MQINQLSYADQVHESNIEKQVQSTGRYLTEFLCVAAFIPTPGKVMERQFGLGSSALRDKFDHTPALLNNAAREELRGKTSFHCQLTWPTPEALVRENIECPYTRESVQSMFQSKDGGFLKMHMLEELFKGNTLTFIDSVTVTDAYVA